MALPDTVALLLRIGFQHLVTEANAEAGVARVQELIGQDFAHQEPPGQVPSDRALHEAVAACLRDGLLREPVRLPAGALQCHWRLELTPKGVTAGRALVNEVACPATDPTTDPGMVPTTQTTGAR